MLLHRSLISSEGDVKDLQDEAGKQQKLHFYTSGVLAVLVIVAIVASVV